MFAGRSYAPVRAKCVVRRTSSVKFIMFQWRLYAPFGAPVLFTADVQKHKTNEQYEKTQGVVNMQKLSNNPYGLNIVYVWTRLEPTLGQIWVMSKRPCFWNSQCSSESTEKCLNKLNCWLWAFSAKLSERQFDRSVANTYSKKTRSCVLGWSPKNTFESTGGRSRSIASAKWIEQRRLLFQWNEYIETWFDSTGGDPGR